MLHLIDFGIAQRFLSEDGKHRPMRENAEFVGNLIFCSKNIFAEISNTCEIYYVIAQSRRDDIIGLSYLLLFLLNGQVPWIRDKSVSLKRQYAIISKIKRKLSAKDLCIDRAGSILIITFKEPLLDFMHYAYQL